MPAPTNLFDHGRRLRREGSTIMRPVVQACNPKPSHPLQRPRPRLDALQPTPLVPSRNTSPSSHPVAALQRIEFVDVTKVRGRRGFSVNIYHRNPQTRIPVRGQYGHPQLSLEAQRRRFAAPSRTVHVDFDEFLRLRYDAHAIARASHVRESCAFCHHTMFLNSSSSVRPRWATRWFQSNAKECRMLTAYLNAMLEIVRQIPTCSDDQFCRGREQIPRLLRILLQAYEPQA